MIDKTPMPLASGNYVWCEQCRAYTDRGEGTAAECSHRRKGSFVKMLVKYMIMMPKGYNALWTCRVCRTSFLIPEGASALQQYTKDTFLCDACAATHQGAYR